jgi:hypothetical protein
MLRALRKRWKLIKKIELRELRAMTPTEKFRQLAKLFQSRRIFKMKRPTKANYLNSNWAILRERLLNAK